MEKILFEERGFFVQFIIIIKGMQKNKITIISRNEYENADIETQSKQFYFDENRIHYQNKLQIMQNKHGAKQGINVINNLCKVQKNKLTKTTFIYFQDKVIKIQDQFYLQNSMKNVKVDSQIFQIKKPINDKINSNSQNISNSNQNKKKKKKKDLKNIVKNIVKIFIHWLDKYNNKQKTMHSMNKLLQFHKYNNSLVKAMSQIPQINQAFVIFLKTQSQDLVQSSRIHDKPTHLQVLRKYQSIFSVNKKSALGMSTSVNGSNSNSGNSSQNKNQSGSEDKQKFSMNQLNQDNMNMNNMRGQKMFTDPNDQMNQNNNIQKASDSDKLFNNSSNSDNNRNRSMMSSSNQQRGQRMSNRQNLFFSSSGSDQS